MKIFHFARNEASCKHPLRKLEIHPSIQAIKQNISLNQDFNFSNTEVRDILKETAASNNKKNGTFGNIPAKRLKDMSGICKIG